MVGDEDACVGVEGDNGVGDLGIESEKFLVVGGRAVDDRGRPPSSDRG